MSKLYICKICNEKVKNINRHVSRKHQITALEYYVQYEDFQIPKCKICNKDAKHRRGLEFLVTCGSKECISLINKHDNESRKNLSIKRKEYLRKNKEKHNWSLFKNQETEPERKFRKVLETRPNIKFYQYYKPKESDRFYELDFAIPEKKIAFEINGGQHYDKEGNLAPYYQQRHDYLVSLGWTVIEIHYSICFNKEKIKEIISNTLNGNIDFANHICNEVINYRNKIKEERKNCKKKKDKKNKDQKNKKKKQNTDNRKIYKQIMKVQREYDRFCTIVDTIKSYGENMGLINVLSEKLGVTHTQVRRILNKYNLDIKLRKSPNHLI